MAQKNIIPVGPQHPVLPEPIHFDLVTEDEKIIDAIPSISYVHRGLERLVETRDFIDFVHVADRICGLCSFMHSLGYCQAVEAIMKVEVTTPDEYQGDLLGDINRRRGKIANIEAKDTSTVLSAEVPLAEVTTYARSLSSITGGRGSYHMEYSHYDEVPSHLQSKIIASAKAERTGAEEEEA